MIESSNSHSRQQGVMVLVLTRQAHTSLSTVQEMIMLSFKRLLIRFC